MKSDTARLTPVQIKDAEFLAKLISGEDVLLYTANSFPINTEEERRWIEAMTVGQGSAKTDVIFTVCLQNGKPIGIVGLHNINWINRSAEFGIIIDAEAREKGNGEKATRAIISYAFETLNLHRIYSDVYENNVASLALHKKCGFEKEGVEIDGVFKNGAYLNVIRFAIINS